MEHALGLGSVLGQLRRALDLRNRYTPCAVGAAEGALPEGELRAEFRDGLVQVVRAADGVSVLSPSVSVGEFYKDMGDLFAIRTDGSIGTFCFHRLRLLQTKFELYMMSNFDEESREQCDNAHRDFYNVRKVDTHIHHSAAMNGKHLLRFIKKKIKRHGDDIVITKRGKPMSLRDLFTDLGIAPYDLSLDKLNVMADATVFQRFDRFNSKYNPVNQPDLRTVFLKTDNEMQGRYLAELTQEILDDLVESKYQHVEWRLSIYGRKRDEWTKLAKWVLTNKLVSPQNRWMIQVPRLYSLYRSSGAIANFQDMLDNIFLPMFEATLDPTADPHLTEFLGLVSGFDSVDDESKSNKPGDRTFSSRERTPVEWNIQENPSYKYYNFYLQSNLRMLNRLRAMKGMSQFDYRPHAGEAGELHHLDTAFLLADGINHGINLRKSMSLQYLYYLARIGMAVSPCSNNHLFLSYQKCPFNEFFTRGLNVSLSTDDPLMFHQTREPLMEEYSLAKQFFRLSHVDMCELARNSVLQSGFPKETKAQWLGSADPATNNIAKTNVPNVRVRFRRHCHADEMKLILHEEDAAMMAFREGIPTLRRKFSGDSEEIDTTAEEPEAAVVAEKEMPPPIGPPPYKRMRSSPMFGPVVAPPNSLIGDDSDVALLDQLEMLPPSLRSPGELHSPRNGTDLQSPEGSPRGRPDSADASPRRPQR